MGEDLDRYGAAYTASFRYHEDNVLMLSWYARRMIATLRARNVRSLLSLGIGHAVVSRMLMRELVPSLESYCIVEGSADAIESFRRGPLPGNVELVNARFEDYVAPRHYGAVEMGFVLEHVDDPELVLRRYMGVLSPTGIMAIVVPNARSLHRLFGKAAGLLDDLYRLSSADLELGHKRYFDLARITDMVNSAGLTITNTEGVYLKCLTADQLKSLKLSEAVWRAFLDVGVAFPEIANGIYIEATRT